VKVIQSEADKIKVDNFQKFAALAVSNQQADDSQQQDNQQQQAA
jgi:hypothetical protein